MAANPKGAVPVRFGNEGVRAKGKRMIGAYVDAELYDKVHALASKAGTDVSAIIIRAVTALK